MEREIKGFDYLVSREQIDQYLTWSQERRLEWLLAANRLRKYLPLQIIALQNAFRQGKI